MQILLAGDKPATQTLEPEHLITLEKNWRDSLPRPTFFQLLETYGPECYGAAQHGLGVKIKNLKSDLLAQAIRRNSTYKIIARITDPAMRRETPKFVESIFNREREETERQLKQSKYFLAFVRKQLARAQALKKGRALPAEDSGKITEYDVARAKEVPLVSLYVGKLHKEWNRMTGLCPFHNERHGSFTIYLESNTFHCFGCGAGRDVVDFVMKQQNVDFLSAVKTLLNRV